MSGKKYIEAELLALLKLKDKTAFGEFYDNYSGALYSVILRILNGDEESSQDVLQDTFVKIWKNMDSYDASKGSLFTWILNIARNTAIDKTRQKRNYSIQSLEDSVRIVDLKFNHTSNTDKIGLKEAIKNLKPEYQSVIDLAYFGGFTQEEISTHLKLPLGTVKTRVRSALIELRKIFND